MESQTGRDNDKAILRFKVMIINTAELKKVLEDADFDGITLQLTQAISNPAAGNNASEEDDGFRLYNDRSGLNADNSNRTRSRGRARSFFCKRR